MTAARSWKPLTVLAALIAVVLVLALAAGAPNGKPSLSTRVEQVATQLRCPVCQGESVYDSPSSLAAAMRSIIRQRLHSGQSEGQVKAYFVSRYGQWVLLAPPGTGIGRLAWLAPPAAILIGLIVVAFALTRWRRNKYGISTAGSESPEEVQALREQLDVRLDDGLISPAEYQAARQQLGSAEPKPSSTKPPRRTSNRQWLQLLAMGSAAILIAASISLAVQNRGSGPITGTVSSAAPPSTPTSANLPPDLRAAAARVTAHPHRASAWVDLATALLLHNNEGQAIASYREAIKLDPTWIPARLGLAFVEIGQGHDTRALNLLKYPMRKAPASSRVWMLEGLAYGHQPGQLAKAKADIQEALRLKPSPGIAEELRLWLGQLQKGRLIP